MDHATAVLGVSERRACRVLGQARAVQRYTPIERDDEDALTKRIVELASVYTINVRVNLGREEDYPLARLALGRLRNGFARIHN